MTLLKLEKKSHHPFVKIIKGDILFYRLKHPRQRATLMRYIRTPWENVALAPVHIKPGSTAANLPYACYPVKRARFSAPAGASRRATAANRRLRPVAHPEGARGQSRGRGGSRTLTGLLAAWYGSPGFSGKTAVFLPGWPGTPVGPVRHLCRWASLGKPFSAGGRGRYRGPLPKRGRRETPTMRLWSSTGFLIPWPPPTRRDASARPTHLRDSWRKHFRQPDV